MNDLLVKFLHDSYNDHPFLKLIRVPRGLVGKLLSNRDGAQDARGEL